MKNRKISGTH